MMRRILPKYFSGCRYINALRKEDQRAASFGEVRLYWIDFMETDR
jgi:hypothetical protein